MVPSDTSSEGTPAPSTSPAPATVPTPAWAEWLTATASALYAWLMRPRVRLTVTGGLLLLVGLLIATNTVWTLPLVIVGALMVAVAWMGHRLEGRFALEWGEAGTQLAFKATIKAPQPTTESPALRAGSRVAPPPAPTAPVALTKAADDAIAADEVIEGEAHTVEINVAELKALIAAAEAGETGEAVKAPAAPVRDIRIRRLAEEPDRTPRPAG